MNILEAFTHPVIFTDLQIAGMVTAALIGIGMAYLIRLAIEA